MAHHGTNAIRTPTDRVVVAVLAVAGAALLGWSNGVGRWLGAAALLIATYELRALQLQWPHWGAHVRRALPYTIVIIAFVALFWEPLLGRPPATRDHGIHYFQTHLLFSEFLPRGTTWGWSRSFGAGYPYGESYPTLGYLVCGLPHLLSLGALDLRASYALSFAGIWGLGAFAVGWFAHGIARAMKLRGEASDWAFAIGALLWLFDAGASRQGGWNYLVFHGVWPQMFSTVLWTLSLRATAHAMRTPSPRWVGLAALALGGSVCAHPFGMVATAGSALIWLVVLALSREDIRPAPLRTWAAIHVGAFAIGSSTTLVFFESAAGMNRSPVPWASLSTLGAEIATGTLFPTHWAWLGPLFVLGAIAIVRRPTANGLLALGLVGGLLVLGSHETLTALRLDLVAAGFKNLQFPRVSIELKPLLFAIAAVGAVAGLRWLPRRSAPSRARAWSVALLAAPLLVGMLDGVGRLKTRPVGALETLQGTGHGEAEAALTRALQAEANAASVEQPMRVAFLRHKMSGGTYPIFSITDGPSALVLDGHVPAVNFKVRVTRTAAAYDALGVTHVVHDRPLPDNEARFAERLTPLDTFGPYRLARYTPQASTPLIDVPGGEASELIVEDERIKTTITVARPTRVVVRQAPHLRWEATLDGEPLEILPSRSISGLTLSAVDIARSGVLEFRYRRRSIEDAAGWLALVTTLLAIASLIRGQPIPWPTRAWPKHVPALLVVAGLLAWVFVRQRQDAQLDGTWQHIASKVAYRDAPGPEEEAEPSQRPHLVRDLVIDEVVTVRRDPQRTCVGIMGKDVLAGCSEAEHEPSLATSYRAPYLYRCIEFGLSPGGRATIDLGPGNEDIVGVLERRLMGSSGKGVRFGTLGDPTRLQRDKTNFYIAKGTAEPRATATVVNAGRHIEHFCIAAAEVSAPAE